MIEFRCKNCDAELDVENAAGGVAVCKYCGSKFTLPKTGQKDEVLSLLRMGQNELNCCDFARAYTAFSKAAELDESEPEAYFGMALAEFGVQYLKDTVNNRLQPVCYAVGEKKFAEDKNFCKALSLATSEQRAEYACRAEEIDYIRKEFFELERAGYNYDCFICVKVTEENGDPTRDSLDAGKIYHALTKCGYKPFYSEYEIGARTGADYEAMILYALYRAKCMLVVCSNEEYLQTKWVKNEYTRFAAMIADEQKEKNSLTFVFHGKPVEKLPGIKGKIQGVDFTSFDALDKIRSFIDRCDGEKRAARDAAARREREAQEAAARKEKEEREAAAKREREEKERALMQELAEAKAALERAAKRSEDFSKQPAPAAAPTSDNGKTQTVSPQPPLAGAQTAVQKLAETLGEVRTAAEKNAPQPSPLSDFIIRNGELVKYKGLGGDVVIPDCVTKIGLGYQRDYRGNIEGSARAFADCKTITSVHIPASVKTIGNEAFAKCSALRKVTFAEGVAEILIDAFRECTALEEVYIPASVQQVDNSAFGGCIALKRLEVAAGNSTYYSRNQCILRKKDNALYIGCNGSVIPEGTASIVPFALNGFISLKELHIPASLTKIEANALSGLGGLTSLTVAEQNPVYYSKGNCVIERATKTLVAGCKTGVIPPEVTKIGDNAFAYNRALTEIALPAKLEEIGDSAFSHCANLKRVDFPVGLKKIGSHAFEWSGLTALSIPSGVQEIGFRAFAYCEQLCEITLASDIMLTAISEYGYTFSGCKALQKVTAPSRFKSKTALFRSDPRHKIEFVFTENARAGGKVSQPSAAVRPAQPVTQSAQPVAAQPKSAAQPAKVAKKPKPAPKPPVPQVPVEQISLQECIDLAESGDPEAMYELALRYENGKGVTKDLAKAIKWCRKAAMENHSDAQNHMGYCYAEGLGVEKNHKEANDWYNTAAQRGNRKAQFNLGNAYYYGRGVQQDYAKAVEWFRKSAAQNLEQAIKALAVCYEYGRGVKRDYQMAVETYARIGKMPIFECVNGGTVLRKYCGKGGNVVIPNGITEIAPDAFYKCSNLKSVTIPRSVTVIYSAFDQCEGLETIVIPDSVQHMGMYVFNRCPSLHTVYCETKKPLFGLPKGWEKGWDTTFAKKLKVVWNYKG